MDESEHIWGETLREGETALEPGEPERSLPERCKRCTLLGLGLSFALQAPSLFTAFTAAHQGRIDGGGGGFTACVFVPFLLVVLLMLGVQALLFVIGPNSREMLPKLLFSASAVALAFAAIPLRSVLHERQIRAVIERADPVIEAVRRYRRREGALPESLEDLYPTYLAEWPRVPELHYGTREVDSWDLSVSTSDGWFDFSRLYYLPEQNYPATDRRYGKWAFFAD